jgi:hypothetical protein
MELLLDNLELIDLGKNLDGASIICTEGRCWITQTGDSRDHILTSGQRFTVRSGGRLIVNAAGPCRLKVSAPRMEPFIPLRRLLQVTALSR